MTLGAGGDPASDGRARVLLIGHTLTLRFQLAAALEAEFSVLLAPDGDQGLRMLYETRSNVVLLDANLSSWAEHELCRRIGEIAGTPVILIGAHVVEES